MNINNIKIKFPQLTLGQFLKFLPWLVIVILLIAIGLSGNFLYHYFYSTVAQAEKVFLLRNEISLKQIDVQLYQNVMSGLKIKKESDQKELQNLTDPFGEAASDISATEKIKTQN
jgi:hypothetical protein